MKRSVRLFWLVVISLCLALVLPLSLSAQSDVPTVAVGDTVEVERNRVEFMLDAQEGQTVTLRWEGRFTLDRRCEAPYPNIIYVQTEITNAAGEPVPQVGLLHEVTDDTLSYTNEVYRLEGLGPYHVSAVQCNGFSVSVSILDGDTISRMVQPAISVGGTANIDAMSVGPDQLLVIPLNVQTGEVFTVDAHFINNARADDYNMYVFLVRDANGHLVPSDFSTRLPLGYSLITPVYTVNGPTPYTLEFVDLRGLAEDYSVTDGQVTSDLSYTVNILQGNTLVEDRGVVPLDTPVEGIFTPNIPIIYTFDVPEGERYTFQLAYSGFTPRHDFFNADLESADVVDTFANPPNAYNWNMRFQGPPPYTFYFSGEGTYSLVLESGNNIETHERGRLAPGQSLSVTIPADDDVIDYVALDVDPASTVTLQWGITQTEFAVQDTDGDFLFSSNDDWNDGFATIDLTQGTAPFILRLDDARYVGQTITFTLAEGEVPLGADAAAPAPAADTSASSETSTDNSTTSAAAASCSVSAGGSINQRSGPGTNFAVSGTLAPGSSASVDGQTTGADGFTWYRLTTGVWVRGDLVTASADCSAVPQVTS
jgi:hypothetical protein